jgi:hypothetical protein
MPNRSDIRSDPSDGSVQQGVPLRLALHVYDVDNGSCIPLSGAQVMSGMPILRESIQVFRTLALGE